ncbi:uncharacterized protein V6R79_003717 [Siganus canaliculatus]
MSLGPFFTVKPSVHEHDESYVRAHEAPLIVLTIGPCAEWKAAYHDAGLGVTSTFSISALK